MIRTVSNTYFSAIVFSLIIFSIHLLPIGLEKGALILSAMLFGLSLFLDIVCQRFRILGIKSHLPMVIASLLAILSFKYLNLELVIVGFLWIIAIYLSFRHREEEANPAYSLIYIGVLLGIAQTIEQWAIFLFLPFFIMFFQSAVNQMRFYILSLLYFMLVLFIYVSVIYVMEIIDQAWLLLPDPTFDYTLFNTALVKVYLPFVILMLVIHLLSMGSYKFRYPNRSLIINYMLLIQLVVGAVLILITANSAFFVLMILPLSVMLSVGFAFNENKLFIDAGFVAFVLFTAALSVMEWQGLIQF